MRATYFGSQVIEMTIIRQCTELIDYYVRSGNLLAREELRFLIGDERFGLPKTSGWAFAVLPKNVGD